MRFLCFVLLRKLLCQEISRLIFGFLIKKAFWNVIIISDFAGSNVCHTFRLFLYETLNFMELKIFNRFTRNPIVNNIEYPTENGK